MSIRLATILGCTILFHAAFAEAASAQESLPDTLPQYEKTTAATSDSVSLVAAADDALQGLSSVPVPMVVKKYVRGKSSVVIELQPAPNPKIRWHNRGGTVRIVKDGRRIVLARR